jgi:hypothetical protein
LTDPENPVYINSNYDINTGVYTRCDGGPEQFQVHTYGTEDNPAYYNHVACVQGTGSPVCH